MRGENRDSLADMLETGQDVALHEPRVRSLQSEALTKSRERVDKSRGITNPTDHDDTGDPSRNAAHERHLGHRLWDIDRASVLRRGEAFVAGCLDK